MTTKQHKPPKLQTAMRLDESPTPAPFAMCRPTERPVFQCDDKGREFATKDDLVERECAAGEPKPQEVHESKPGK